MVRSSKLTYFAILVTLAALLPTECSVAQESSAHPIQHDGFKILGASTCEQCHKNGHFSPSHTVAGYEYTIWANQDPHSCAYASLFKEQSLAIARNLKLKVPPHKNDLCLNCHATNASHEQLVPNSKHTLTDGVGCESCHGGADQWIVAHTLSSWKSCSPSQKSAMGFVDTDNIAIRTSKCVECHVGSPGRDVNHDLIAAGHPRLYFEMAAYQAKMPRHWSRAKDLAINGAATEYKLWLVGQFVSASAALEQMQRRAETSSAPWPEFAEYNCFSCHHELDKERWKEQDFFANDGATPDWGSWHFSMMQNGLASTDSIQGQEIADQLATIRTELSTYSPDRERVTPLTDAMKVYLDEFAKYLASQRVLDTTDQARRIRTGENYDTKYNWDSLAQRYLATVALRQARKDEQSYGGQQPSYELNDTKLQLEDIRNMLRFMDGQNGPRDSDNRQDDQLRQRLEAIDQQLLN